MQSSERNFWSSSRRACLALGAVAEGDEIIGMLHVGDIPSPFCRRSVFFHWGDPCIAP